MNHSFWKIIKKYKRERDVSFNDYCLNHVDYGNYIWDC